MSETVICGTVFMPVMKCIWVLSWFMNLNKDLLSCVCGVCVIQLLSTRSSLQVQGTKLFSGSTDVAVALSDTVASLAGTEKNSLHLR